MQWLYIFHLGGDKTLRFEVLLDDATLSLVAAPRSEYPQWTRLSYRQCSNCPLQEKDYPRCPIAASLAEVTDYFQDIVSYASVDVEIITQERTYKKSVAVQEALSSLIGIYMVTSGCPVMDKLRPLVKTHLPFASLGETTYRVVSMYLLAQYFRNKNGQEPDWELHKLINIYEEIQTVNRSSHKRIIDFMDKDAVLNAIVRLDIYAEVTREELLGKRLQDMARLFSSYFSDPPAD
jgi:hypothetical protein